MNTNYFDNFNKNISEDCITVSTKRPTISINIVEKNKNNTNNNYEILIKNKVRGKYAIMFRIEDFKEKANYLKLGKRGSTKDNDISIVDDNIYQIEIKRSNRSGGHYVTPQFKSGKLWLKHILRLAAPNDYTSISNIYNICLIVPKTHRSSLSRQKNNYCICGSCSDFITFKLNNSSNVVDITNMIISTLAKRNNTPHTTLI